MIPFVVGLGVALLATAVLIPLLARAGVWDVANARSSHTGAIPRGGGIGILAGVLAGVLASGTQGSRVAWTMFGLIVAMAAIGLADDFSGIRVSTRLVGQVIVAATAAGLLADTARSGWAVVAPAVVGAVWLVSYVNAFNFMDGINGISAVSGALAGAWYAWVGHRIESSILVLFGLALLGACLGFLPWNAPRARVFLGDAGSYGVGALIAALAFVTWLSGAGLTWTLAPLAVYLADTAWALIKRAGRKNALGVAHREHVYQRLVDGGRSHVLTAAVVAAAGGIVCFGAARLGTVPAICIGVLVVVGYLSLPVLVGQRQGVG
jgi:UDP-N-acetylmuramyl pentapeptide phosphotransferase/UDP-N-acetylglucosamine-1-phosphate transferase